MNIATGTIKAWAVEVLREKLQKMNKRAKKCGTEPMTLVVDKEYDKYVGKDDLGLDKYVRLADVTIVGLPPKIEGWRLLAKITPVEEVEGQNFVKTIPGFEGNLDEKYRTIDMVCEHCGHKRRRNDVFVIEKDGVEKVIGRNCIADYCRDQDVDRLIAWSDWTDLAAGLLSEDYDDLYDGPRYKPCSPIKYFLKTTSIVIRRLGWLSRGKAREMEYGPQSTADIVCYLQWSRTDEHKRKFIKKNDLYSNEHDTTLAEKALEWIRNVDDISNDYMYNLKMACSGEVVTYDSSGLVASLIPAYQRHMEQEIKRAKIRKAAANREYVGEIKKRMRGLKLTVIGTTCTDSDWGVKTFIRFLDENENLVVWSASGDRTEEFLQGQSYIVDATPQKHVDHDVYGKQTFVNRVTVKRELDCEETLSS